MSYCHLFQAGSLAVRMSEGRVALTFYGVLAGEDVRWAIEHLMGQRCALESLITIDLGGAIWPSRSEADLARLRPCDALGGGECPAVFALVVPAGELDWYRAYASRMAVQGALIGAFADAAEAIEWGEARARVLMSQRQRLWEQRRSRGAEVYCQIAGHPLLSRKPGLVVPDLQSHRASERDPGPLVKAP